MRAPARLAWSMRRGSSPSVLTYAFCSPCVSPASQTTKVEIDGAEQVVHVYIRRGDVLFARPDRCLSGRMITFVLQQMLGVKVFGRVFDEPDFRVMDGCECMNPLRGNDVVFTGMAGVRSE